MVSYFFILIKYFNYLYVFIGVSPPYDIKLNVQAEPYVTNYHRANLTVTFKVRSLYPIKRYVGFKQLIFIDNYVNLNEIFNLIQCYYGRYNLWTK